MSIGNLARNSIQYRSHAPAAAGATVLNGNTIDLAGGNAYGVTYLIDFGTIGAIAGTPTLTIQESDDGSTWTNVKDAVSGNDAQIALTTAFSGKLVAVDHIQPRHRYARLVIDRGGSTNSMVLNSVIAVVLGPRVKPQSQSAGDANGNASFAGKS